ncbi:MAG TPA: hypothetical protein DCK95_00700 [Anaerolineaceae bacterium]|nr:hypothetical protein [Anaerolineaceae bacterium]
MKRTGLGYALNATSLGCTAGCRMNIEDYPILGEMVTVTAPDGSTIYGVVTNIHILDDGLVRQLATTEPIDSKVIEDNRKYRTVPLEFTLAFVGFKKEEKVIHLLPPTPPLSLESVFRCSDDELRTFMQAGKIGGYLRYLVGEKQILNFDLVAAHFRYTMAIFNEEEKQGWLEQSTRTLTHLYRNDYATLNQLLHSLAESAMFNS